MRRGQARGLSHLPLNISLMLQKDAFCLGLCLTEPSARHRWWEPSPMFSPVAHNASITCLSGVTEVKYGALYICGNGLFSFSVSLSLTLTHTLFSVTHSFSLSLSLSLCHSLFLSLSMVALLLVVLSRDIVTALVCV